MPQNYNIRSDSAQRSIAAVEVDQGLRAYMLRVYNYMASGVLLTGIMALLVYRMPALASLIFEIGPGGAIVGYTGLGIVTLISPLAFVLVMRFGLNRMRSTTVQALFWAFCAVMGLSISSIMFVYTGVSVAKVFFITASAFGALSLWGYTTKKDMTGWGSFLIMGLFGIIIASIVNIWLASPAMDFMVSIIGVLIFAGLTAYDTQRIKRMYYEGDSEGIMTKKAVMGALSLYLDFINMFLMMLRLFGNRN